MKREHLEELRSLKIESNKLEIKILSRIENSNYRTYGDTAGDYSTGKKRIIQITGQADPVIEKYVNKLNIKKKVIDEKILNMEAWLDSIEDSRTRIVMRMYFQDGLSQKKIGEELNLDRSVVSRIIKDAFK